MARGEQVNVDVCGVYNRYHANGARAFYVGEPPADVMDFHNKSSGVFDVIQDMLRPNLPVAELVTRIRAYYDEVGIWSEAGWVGGYELGIGFPPDWVGNFVYEMSDTDSDRIFEPGPIVNFAAHFNYRDPVSLARADRRRGPASDGMSVVSRAAAPARGEEPAAVNRCCRASRCPPGAAACTSCNRAPSSR